MLSRASGSEIPLSLSYTSYRCVSWVVNFDLILLVFSRRWGHYYFTSTCFFFVFDDLKKKHQEVFWETSLNLRRRRKKCDRKGQQKILGVFLCLSVYQLLINVYLNGFLLSRQKVPEQRSFYIISCPPNRDSFNVEIGQDTKTNTQLLIHTENLNLYAIYLNTFIWRWFEILWIYVWCQSITFLFSPHSMNYTVDRLHCPPNCPTQHRSHQCSWHTFSWCMPRVFPCCLWQSISARICHRIWNIGAKFLHDNIYINAMVWSTDLLFHLGTGLPHFFRVSILLYGNGKDAFLGECCVQRKHAHQNEIRTYTSDKDVPVKVKKCVCVMIIYWYKYQRNARFTLIAGTGTDSPRLTLIGLCQQPAHKSVIVRQLNWNSPHNLAVPAERFWPNRQWHVWPLIRPICWSLLAASFLEFISRTFNKNNYCKNADVTCLLYVRVVV